ncbi:acetate--CoA ligase family protein [Schauerella aestuarii]|uniref:acetate--CoA ligase family protein n=1 Tax=Schauerella aestuarii TaxID=2511204 RepID=UPI00137006AA|nr:acetate--CoA ligase family protein [Achromobacter aestuarii]MYZ42819.1 CoA-binding protein [Achromobacter aestuarii]
MPQGTPHESLEKLLNPRSIAIFGASDNVDKIGGRPIYYMGQHGYRGTIYPINPQRDRVQGLRSYAALRDLPHTPDLAIVAVAGQGAVDAVDACGAMGVGAAIVIAAGFSETGAVGRALQDAMTQRARAAGTRIVGPNSQGMANFGTGAIASFSTMFLEVPPADGPVAVISQSGGMSAMIYGLLRQRGLGVRHMHATGNEADVTVSELACAVLADPDVRIVLLYLESLQDAATLARAAALARARGVPIVAVKAGRSAGGARAAASHTGALANEDRSVTAFCERHGILRARDPQELARYAELAMRGPLPQGKRVVVVSNSGASCVLASDAADDCGLEIAPLAASTQTALRACLPGFATTDNPVDITAALLSNNGLFGEVLPAIGDDPAADMFVIDIPVAGRGYDVASFARDTAQFAQRARKPVAVVAWQADVAAAFRDQGVTVYADEQQAMQAFAGLARLGRMHAQPPLPVEEGETSASRASAHVKDVRAAGATGTLSEAASLALLGRCGLPVTPHAVCRDADTAVAAWRRFGSAVAIKACSAALPHKSELGLVDLNVNDEPSVRAAIARQHLIVQGLHVAFEGWIVAPMQPALQECMIGVHADPVFGPIVMAGGGGKYVETMQDVAVLLPPFGLQEAESRIRALRIGALLDGVRGEAAADVRALAQLMVDVGQLALDAGPALQSLDLNPVRVRPAGEGVVIVDALWEGAADIRSDRHQTRAKVDNEP